MKLFLMGLSFYPLLLIFFISVWFRFDILSITMLFIMTFFTMLTPFIIIFIGTVVIPAKKQDAKEKEGEA